MGPGPRSTYSRPHGQPTLPVESNVTLLQVCPSQLQAQSEPSGGQFSIQYQQVLS